MSTQARTSERDIGFLRRVRLLPSPARLFIVVLGTCAAAPAAAYLYAVFGDGWFASAIGAGTSFVGLAAIVVGATALLAFQRPRSKSPAAYVRQLRDCVHDLQSDLDAGLRRRPGEGKEKEDAVQHPSEP